MRIFEASRPDVVIHTAALKHVPLLEKYPIEAIETNVLGSLAVLQSAAAVGVQRFINISTDKANEPSTAYGYSKRIAEKLTAYFNGASGGRYISVRFSNILGSRGSVVPTFQEQIRRGGPITLTDPNAARHFLTPFETCSLVVQAGAQGAGGEVLVATSGTPVHIRDLASVLIRHAGTSIEIEHTGLRRGESLEEQPVDRENLDNGGSDSLFFRTWVKPISAEIVHAASAATTHPIARLRLLASLESAPMISTARF
jgi:FlaA1/EpsC-like NDP-sugar epimerase